MAIYLDINQFEVVEQVHLDFQGKQMEEMAPLGKALIQLLPGKKLEEIPGLGMDQLLPLIPSDSPFHRKFAQGDLPLIPLPLWLLRKSLQDYRGEAPPHADQAGSTEEDLLCRCFGIYGKEIQEFLKEHPESQLRDISQALGAGAACTSCIKDIQRTLLSHQYPKASVKKKKMELLAGLTPVQFALEAQPRIDAWISHSHSNFLGRPWKMELMKIQGKVLYFRVWPLSKKTEGQKEIQEIMEKLRLLFKEDLLLAFFD